MPVHIIFSCFQKPLNLKTVQFHQTLRHMFGVGHNRGSRIRQEQKTLRSSFAKFFAPKTKVLLLEERLGSRLSPPNFEIFIIFPNFLRFLVLSSLETCDATHMQTLLC